jgi:hypothetical protein
VCDDGNNTAGDGCSPTCQIEGQCVLAVEKTCAVPQPLAPFVCSDAKPIHSLTLKWEPGSNTDPTRWVLTNPGQVIDIKAWNGSPGDILVATETNIQPGDVITVTGFSGSVNDVYWEIFAAGTGFGSKLGNSAFNLSCSDVNMNTSDDCGKLEGDLKVTSGFTGLINDWRFEGMGGDTGALVCTPAAPTATSECVVENTPVDCTTQGKPTSLTLYNGNTCANPANNNPQSGSSSAPVASIAQLITVTSTGLLDQSRHGQSRRHLHRQRRQLPGSVAVHADERRRNGRRIDPHLVLAGPGGRQRVQA